MLPAGNSDTRLLFIPFCATIALVAMLSAAPADAAAISVLAGASVTASRDTTPVLFFDVIGERRQSGRLTWQPAASLGWIAGRSVRDDLDRNVAIAGFGVRLVDWWKRAFFSTQLGYAAQTTAAISSHGQFISTLGWQGERGVVMLRHISNADAFGGRNLGETMLLFGVTF